MTELSIQNMIKPDIKNIQRPHWSGLETRVKRADQGYLSLDRNENQDRILRAEIVRIIQEELDLGQAMVYKDYFNLYHKLADFYSISTNNILITGGCDEAIRLTFEATVNTKTRYLYPTPTYRGATTNIVDLNPTMIAVGETEFEIEQGLYSIGGIHLCYICSPNNPSGRVYSADQIEYWIKTFNNTVFFIDNTYADFVDESYDHLIKYKNCLIGKSYSKSWGLAGQRFGLLLGHSETIEQITKIRPIMSVSSITLDLVSYLVDHNSIVTDSIVRNKNGIKTVYKYFNKYEVLSQPNVNHIQFIADQYTIDSLDAAKILYGRENNTVRLTTMPTDQFNELCLSTFK